MKIGTCVIALVCVACTACSGTVVLVGDGGAGDATAGDAIADAPGDVGVCVPGTCKVTPVATCEAPSGPTGNGCCRCQGDECAQFCKCAAPDTPIATPNGDRPIASLRVGDLVYSVHDRAIVAVPIARVNRSHVDAEHVMVRVRLADGTTLRISPSHPTADGRSFGELRVGDPLDRAEVAEVAIVRYGEPFTYDILPASSTGTYFAGGALIGSTLFTPAPTTPPAAPPKN